MRFSSQLHSLKKIEICPLTFEQRHESTPARDGTLAIMLTERKLHVEQGYATNNQHNTVRYQESPCAREDEFEQFYVCIPHQIWRIIINTLAAVWEDVEKDRERVALRHKKKTRKNIYICAPDRNKCPVKHGKILFTFHKAHSFITNPLS